MARIAALAFAVLTMLSTRATAFHAKPRAARRGVQMSVAKNVRSVAAAALVATTLQSALPVRAETEVRQGMYKEYTVEKKSQAYDDAASGFKSKTQTMSNRGRYAAVLGVLLVGSIIVPMAQYWWYIKDDEPLE